MLLQTFHPPGPGSRRGPASDPSSGAAREGAPGPPCHVVGVRRCRTWIAAEALRALPGGRRRGNDDGPLPDGSVPRRALCGQAAILWRWYCGAHADGDPSHKDFVSDFALQVATATRTTQTRGSASTTTGPRRRGSRPPSRRSPGPTRRGSVPRLTPARRSHRTTPGARKTPHLGSSTTLTQSDSKDRGT